MNEIKIEKEGVNILADNRGLPEEQWRANRMRGIGGSDAGAILRMNSYSSPFMVAMEKLGLAPPKEETDAMKHGRRMEPVLRNEIVQILKEEGAECVAYESPYLYQSAEHPIMLANIDGILDFEKPAVVSGVKLEGLVLLECKAVSGYQSKEWRNNEVPDSYYCQVQHYMAILLLSYAIIVVLIGNRIEYRIVPRNNEFIEKMIVAEEAFWANYIAKRELPEPSGIDNEDDYISALYPADQATDAMVRLPDEMEQLGLHYIEIKDLIKEMEEEKKQIKAQFKHHIGLAKIGIVGSIEVPIIRYQRKQFQKEAFNRDYPGIYDQYCKDVPEERLLIRSKK